MGTKRNGRQLVLRVRVQARHVTRAQPVSEDGVITPNATRTTVNYQMSTSATDLGTFTKGREGNWASPSTPALVLLTRIVDLNNESEKQNPLLLPHLWVVG